MFMRHPALIYGLVLWVGIPLVGYLWERGRTALLEWLRKELLPPPND